MKEDTIHVKIQTKEVRYKYNYCVRKIILKFYYYNKRPTKGIRPKKGTRRFSNKRIDVTSIVSRQSEQFLVLRVTKMKRPNVT